MIQGFYLMPHPPIVVPEVGHGEEKKIIKTSAACQQIGLEINEKQPQTIIIISPHGVLFSDAIAIAYDQEISGSLQQFKANQVKIKKQIDLALTDEILRLANDANIPTIKVNNSVLSDYNRQFELDHGAIVPLSFVERNYTQYQLVHITYGLLKDQDLFRFGMKIKEAINNLNRQVVIIASGDLSHRLTEDGPYSYSPKGKLFDETLIKHLQNGDTLGVFQMDKYVVEEAGECGLRSIFILLGSLNGAFSGQLLSYEGPFGVGYGVMKFNPSESKENFLSRFKELEAARVSEKLTNTNAFVTLARQSIAYYLKNNEKMPLPNDLSEELKKQAGVFVSLKKYGNLRGCIGTFMPTTDSIAQEIINSAIEAAFEDPRFNPLLPSELDELDISVDVLSEPIKATKEELDPKKYGVIVSLGYRRGLLLPDLETVDTVEQQLEIACQKAGISPKSHYDLYKFTVKRHLEGSNND